MAGQPLPYRRGKAARAVAAAIGAGVLSAAAIGSSVAAGSVRAAATLPPTDWPAYLNGPPHTSYNGSQTVITAANAATLTQQWSFTTGSPYLASPTVTSNAVYIGSAQGWFYKLSVHTGAILNKVYI